MLNRTGHEKYFDPKFQSPCVTVLPGEFYTTNLQEEMIVTILGSCVAACIRDPQLGIGGLNHFLLSEPNQDITSHSTRYGSYAMECLINDILKQGGRRENLEIKVFGGADLMRSTTIHIGQKNSDFIRRYLRDEGLKIAAEDLGGNNPRRIHYWPSTGKVIRAVIHPQEQKDLEKNETAYQQKLVVKEKDHGDIELFC
jgi:chemotaxis protein CheD